MTESCINQSEIIAKCQILKKTFIGCVIFVFHIKLFPQVDFRGLTAFCISSIQINLLKRKLSVVTNDYSSNGEKDVFW